MIRIILPTFLLFCSCTSLNNDFTPFTEHKWQVSQETNDEIFTNGTTIKFNTSKNICKINSNKELNFILKDSIFMIDSEIEKLIYQINYKDSILTIKQLYCANPINITLIKTF